MPGRWSRAMMKSLQNAEGEVKSLGTARDPFFHVDDAVRRHLSQLLYRDEAANGDWSARIARLESACQDRDQGGLKSEARETNNVTITINVWIRASISIRTNISTASAPAPAPDSTPTSASASVSASASHQHRH